MKGDVTQMTSIRRFRRRAPYLMMAHVCSYMPTVDRLFSKYVMFLYNKFPRVDVFISKTLNIIVKKVLNLFKW